MLHKKGHFKRKMAFLCSSAAGTEVLQTSTDSSTPAHSKSQLGNKKRETLKRELALPTEIVETLSKLNT